jgi:peptide/nickel transport system permease protein
MEFHDARIHCPEDWEGRYRTAGHRRPEFFLIRMAPGDPALVMAGEAGAGDQIFVAQLREKFGLDKPLPVQLYVYVKGILSLDLGFSFRQQMPVAKLILDRLPATLLLTGTAFAISLAFGVLFGTLAARWAGSWTDTAITVLALIFYATPLFWVALMAILLFSVAMDWLPSFGYETVGANYTGFAHVLDVGAHLIMPATTIGLFFMATYTRMTRASMLEVKRLDFVKTARAKGLRDAVIQRRHVLRNALLPVVTLAGLQAGTLVGGAVLTETVFAWPGIGRLMYEALLQRDYNLLLGVFVVCSAMVLVFNLVTDLIYRSVDPRIEFAA